MRLTRISSLALASMLCGGIALSDQSASPSWEDLLSRMRSERERVVSGVYSASGTETPPGIEEALPVNLYSVFSFAEEKIRFEHRGREWVRRKGELVKADTHRLICLLPDRTYHFSDLTPLSLQLNIVPPGTLRVKGRPGTRGFLDPRCLGLINIDELYDGIRFPDAAEKLRAALARCTARVADEGDGVYRIWAVGRGGRRSYWIDTKGGFTLVRCRVEYGRGNEATGEFTPLSKVVAEDEAMRARMKEKKLGMDLVLDVPGEIEIGWTEFDGVWVPESYWYVMTVLEENDSQEADASPLRPVRSETALTFDWTSVNSKINDDLFDYHSFELPAKTVVFDQRGPETVFVENIGSQPVRRRMVDGEPKSRRPLLIFHLVAAGIAVIIGLGYLAYRRRRRSDSTETQT